MGSSLSQMVRSIKNAGLVMPAQVNYGTTDGLTPPYIQVGEWRAEWLRDTTNGVRVTTFAVLVVAKDLEDAEALAAATDAALTNNYAATNQDIGLLQDTYEVGQTDPNNLYQYGVRMTYTLHEDPNQ